MYYSKCNLGYVVRLDVGEEIQESMRHFAQEVDLRGGFYQGVGAVTQVELAFYNSGTRTYDRHHFEDEYELIALNGNLSWYEGAPAPHTHVSLGDRHFRTLSGHLVRAVSSLTVEIVVLSLDLTLTRKEDPMLKFKGLISPNRSQLKVPF